ncbi:MAG: hypothetical protein HAW67_01805 [Endozoicomonadaceae bacterium]|nr:hypothetical protein [Endozoicomonadaceae bacterium]
MKSAHLWLTMTLLSKILYSVPPVFAISDSCEYTGPPAPAKGVMLLDEVNVLAMNVWGQNNDNNFKCEARLKFIGETIAKSEKKYTIIGLTEVHPPYYFVSCNGKKLVDGLRINGGYQGKKVRWGHPETNWKHYDGGTSLFATSEFPWSPYKDHVERYKPKVKGRTAHGFVHSRISITEELKIDVYVTHIYSNGPGRLGTGACDQQCRRNALQKLANAIHKHSAGSGFPVLVMGDFNIGGPNPSSGSDECIRNRGYGDIMEVLRNPRDLWLEAHPNESGATGAFGLAENPNKKGKLGMNGERIDYIFIMTDSYFTNSPYELVIKDSNDSVNLVNWTMPSYLYIHQNPGNGSRLRTTRIEGPFPVSDHKGIEVSLEIRERLDWVTIIAIIN